MGSKITFMDILRYFCFLIFLIDYHFIYPQEKAVLQHEMTKTSDAIVIGQVKKIQSSWDITHKRIYTDVSIQVNEYLKGNNEGGSITVRHLGGEVGSVGELYSFTPSFVKDEDVLLFLNKDRDGVMKISNGKEGKLSISQSTVSGNKIIAEDIPLDKFVDNIKKVIQQQLK